MQSIMSKWNPDESLFEIIGEELKGIMRVREALKEIGLDITKEIFTSRDEAVVSMLERLKINVMPLGFEQYQLPILMPSKDTMYFITIGKPNALFPTHQHSRDDGFRVIISGSIIYKGLELNSGDWIYVPQGASYSFKVGPSGCTIFHGYGPAPKTSPRI